MGGGRFGGRGGGQKGLPASRFFGPQGGQPYGRGKGAAGGKGGGRAPPIAGSRSAPYPPHQGGKGGKGGGRKSGSIVPQAQPKRNDVHLPHHGSNKYQSEFPFSQVVRKLVEHRLRTPHRSHVHGQLTRVIAHWVSIPTGESQVLNSTATIARRTKGEDSVRIESRETATDTEPEASSSLDARVLICGGLAAVDSAKKHVLSRLSLYAAKQPAGGLQGYGGVCTSGTDSEVIEQLVAKVKDQCGLDLSDVETWYKFVEMEYTPPLRNTVFYLPALWESQSDLFLASAATEEEIEIEEIVEPEISREGMTDDEFTEAKAALEPVKNIVKKVNKTVVSTPISLSLSDCLNADVKKHMPRPTLEFYTAADALDEFLKREMCSILVSTLKDKRTEKQDREEKRKADEAVRIAAKRRREDEDAAKKKAKQDELDALHAKWEVEDQGKTDDEKKESENDRKNAENEILNRKEEDVEEQKQEAQSPAKEDEEEAPKKKLFRTVVDIDQKKYEAFEYFDRGNRPDIRTGTLQSQRLQNLLLCSDDEFSMDDVSALMNAISHPPHSIDYKSLVSFRRQEVCLFSFFEELSAFIICI